MPEHIFISYRRKDSAQVGALAAALKAEGLTVWLDRDEIEDAASIQRRIDAGLAEAGALLAWYSADYPRSRACQWELTAALIAAGAEKDPVRRLLIVNPEATAEHIQPVQARDLQHLAFAGDYADLARRIKAAVAPIVGTLGALRRLTRPEWHGAHGLGSNRFVGRVADLWAVHSALAAGNHAIVAGLPAPRAAGELAQVRGSGGIGKSLLAEEYALRFGAWWPGGVFWLRAYGNSDDPDETAADLAARREATYGSQLAGFAQELGLDTRDKTDAQIRADLGRRLTEPYLWIVDDLPACGRAELERWLAPSSSGQTLVTTRSRRLDGLGAEIDLALLPPEDARALLTLDHSPKPEETNTVEDILRLLDGHALALDVARSACCRQGYAGFLARLEHPDRDALALAAEIARDLPNGHNPHIAATLLGSVRQLDAQGLDCLRLAAQLAAAPIPRDLLAACLAEADRLEHPDAEDRADLGLQQALDHSLAEEAEGPQSVTVHTLVGRTLRFHDPAPERQHQLRRAVLRVLNRVMAAATDIREHRRLLPLLPHALALATDSNNLESLYLAGWLGMFEFEGGRYRNAQTWYEFQCRGRLSLLGEAHPEILISMGNLANSLWLQGDLASARALQEQVLETRREVLGEMHPETLRSINGLAVTIRDQGEGASAQKLQRQCLEAQLQVLGKDHPDTLTSMSNLAQTLLDQGDVNASLALLEQVLEASNKLLGSTHRRTICCMNDLAGALRDKGDLTGARKLQERTLGISKRVLGEDHPNTLTSMNNLADTLRDHGDLAGARALQEQVLESSRRLQGEEHTDTLTCMSNLAITLQAQGNLDGSCMLQEQALEASRRVLGMEHPGTLNCMHNLALTLGDQGDLAGSRALQEKVLEVRRRVLGEEHPDTLLSMNNLAITLWQMGEHHVAMQRMQAAAEGRTSVLGPNHPYTLGSQQAAGQMRAALNRQTG